MTDRPETTAEPNDGERGSANMLWLFGQLLVIPLAALVYSVDLLVKTMREMQKSTSQGIDVILGPSPRLGDPADRDNPTGQGTLKKSDFNAAGMGTTEKQNEILASRGCLTALDTNLRDDLLKLVRYKILFVKRGYEHAFPERESLVWDNLEGSAFTGWKIAEFIQSLDRRDTIIPHSWTSYPPPTDGKGEHKRKLKEGHFLLGLPEEDKKYLRVFYEVLERFPREKFRYEERQIEVLEQIRDNMQQAGPSNSSANATVRVESS
jgi:hypothetical protein